MCSAVLCEAIMVCLTLVDIVLMLTSSLQASNTINMYDVWKVEKRGKKLYIPLIMVTLLSAGWR